MERVSAEKVASTRQERLVSRKSGQTTVGLVEQIAPMFQANLAVVLPADVLDKRVRLR